MQDSLSPPLVARASFLTRWNKFQLRYAPYMFIAPFFLLYAVFGLFPTLFSLFLSFQAWQPAAGLGSMKFVGFSNYTFNLTDPIFWKTLKNTGSLALMSGLPQHLIAIPLAFAIHMGLRKLQSLVTAVYFLPYITSVVAIAMIFTTMFSQDFGVINQVLQAIKHIPLIGSIVPDERINWLGKKEFIQPAISMIVIWRYTGWNTVLYLSGLQAIPRDLYEAASVDGATTWQQFVRITLPLLKPIAFFAVTLTIIGNLQLFEEPFITVGPSGGVGQMGLTTAMWLYRTGFEFNDMGTAAAMSWLLFIVIGLLTLVNNRLFGRGAVAGGEN